MAKLNFSSMTRHASQKEYFLKPISSTFLFELSKFIRLVRGNHTVGGNQCRRWLWASKARRRHKVTSQSDVMLEK